jgi:twitching motility two-component system response regulator PilG
MSKLVVVIDNSITVCKVLETCLRRAGYEVKSFSDGVLALQWLRSPEARIPDLVLIDVCLPRLDGYQVILHLHVQPIFEQTIFIIITRRDGLIDKLKGRLVGARAYLTKPFKTEQLMQLVQSYLGIPILG